MAFDKTPTTWLDSWSEDGTDITVPIATFSELTAAEADASTGDIRKIVFAIVEHLYQQWITTESADRPIKWLMSKTATVDTVRNVMKSRYTVTVETEIGTQEVSDETTSSASATSTATATATSTSTATSSTTSSATTSTSKSVSESATQTVTATGSGTKTDSPTATVTSTATDTQTATSTQTQTPSATGTSTSTSTATSTATATATQ